MHHTAAKDFKPACFLAHIAAGTLAKHAADIHLGAGLSKWKIRRTETDLYIAAIHFFCKKVKRLFQISERNVFINIQSFNLVKETMASCTHRFISVHTAGTNDTDRQFAFLHFTYLNIACMSTK